MVITSVDIAIDTVVRRNNKEILKSRKYASKNKNNRKKMTDKSHSDNENNKNKIKVYILGESMVKRLNVYLLTKIIKHKHGTFVFRGQDQLYSRPSETNFTRDKPRSNHPPCRDQQFKNQKYGQSNSKSQNRSSSFFHPRQKYSS